MALTTVDLNSMVGEGSDEDSRAILKAVNASGRVFRLHTELNGQSVIRLAIGNLATAPEDVELAWQLVRNAIPA